MRFSYRLLRRLGLGAHLAVIVGLAAIPTSILVIEFIESERRDAIEDAEQWARSAARHTVTHHRETMVSTQAVLDASAVMFDTAIPAGHPCAIQVGGKQALWIVTGSGATTCATEPAYTFSNEIAVRIAEQTVTRGFEVLGPYRVASGKMRLFGSLTRQSADGVTWHLIRSIDFDYMPTFDQKLVEPADLVVMTLDREGRIIQRIGPDDRGGANLPAQFVLPKNAADEDTVILNGADGVKRIYAMAALPEYGAKVMVGLSHDAVMATARKKLFGALALFAAVMAVSGLLAWLFIERMVLRSVRKLRDAAVATANGAHDRRVEVADGPAEICELADAFNEMTSKLEYQAFHDQLTGIANRRLINQDIDRHVRDKKAFAVLAIDLDGFKSVNDTHGHAVGDRVLREVALRLNVMLAGDAVIGRTGGDEFIAIVLANEPGDHLIDRAVSIAQRMLDEIGKPFDLRDGIEVTIGGCIGIASWPQDDALAEDVVRKADAALYRSKDSGKNRYAVYRAADDKIGSGDHGNRAA